MGVAVLRSILHLAGLTGLVGNSDAVLCLSLRGFLGGNKELDNLQHYNINNTITSHTIATHPHTLEGFVKQ